MYVSKHQWGNWTSIEHGNSVNNTRTNQLCAHSCCVSSYNTKHLSQSQQSRPVFWILQGFHCASLGMTIPSFTVSLHVFLQLGRRLELHLTGLAGVDSVVCQLLSVLLHVYGQLAVQRELIPTLRANEVLEKEHFKPLLLKRTGATVNISPQMAHSSGTNVTFASQKCIIVSKLKCIKSFLQVKDKMKTTILRQTGFYTKRLFDICQMVHVSMKTSEKQKDFNT